MSGSVFLTHGDCALELRPEIGGSVARFTWRGRDVLRPASADATHPFDMACFPLVPFANRIAGGAFTFEGKRVQLPHTDGRLPHALHGDGWLVPWQVTSSSEDRAALRFEHRAAEWPWRYAAEQSFKLAEDALIISLAATNLAADAMPVSAGFHPYFPRTQDTRFRAAVGGVWLVNASLIPSLHVPQQDLYDISDAMVGTAPFVDNCYTGFTGAAWIEMPEHDLAVALNASEHLRFLHVYLPTEESYFCAEPVSAMPDAFNRPEPHSKTGLRVLAPGDTLTVSMQLRVGNLQHRG
jgi:aldose 1-epimerase